MILCSIMEKLIVPMISMVGSFCVINWKIKDPKLCKNCTRYIIIVIISGHRNCSLNLIRVSCYVMGQLSGTARSISSTRWISGLQRNQSIHVSQCQLDRCNATIVKLKIQTVLPFPSQNFSLSKVEQ